MRNGAQSDGRFVGKLASAALALTLVAAACGDDDDDEGAAAATTGAAATTEAAATTTAATGGTVSAGTEAPTTAAEPEAPCEATVPGSQLDIGLINPTSSLDPVGQLGSYFGGTEVVALYDVLFRFDFETGEYEPQAAESITPNADFTEWTLKLRDDITFPNGDPFDVDNLFAHLDRFAVQGVRNTAIAQLRLITSREKVDATTAKFTLVKPWATFPFVFADDPGSVVNTRVVGTDAAAFGVKPPAEAGIGPYVLERFAANEELVLKARSDYWGGPVCIERLRFVLVPGAKPTYDAYRNGDLDVAYLREDKVVQDAKKDGEPALTEMQDASVIQLFNLRAGNPTADAKVREAIILAIDEKIINERAYGGALRTTRALIHPDSPWYSDAIDELPPPNPDRAKQLVAEAKAAGFDGHVRVGVTTTPPLPDVGIAVEAMLDAVGFDAEQQQFPGQELFLRIVQADFHMGNFGFAIGSNDAPIQLALNFASDSPSNRMGYQNPQMDTLIDDLLAAPTREDAVEVMAEINNLFVADQASLPLAAAEFGLIHKDEVKGIKQTNAIVYLFDDAFIDEE